MKPAVIPQKVPAKNRTFRVVQQSLSKYDVMLHLPSYTEAL